MNKSLLSFLVLITIFFTSCVKPFSPNNKNTITLKFIDDYVLSSDVDPSGNIVGGLSGLDFDGKNTWYFICDDGGRKGTPRFYTGEIDLDEKQFHSVNITNTFYLKTPEGKTFEKGTVDPESIRLDNKRKSLYWTSEGNKKNHVQPFIYQMDLKGNYIKAFQLPNYFQYSNDKEMGFRSNGVFECLSNSFDGKEIVVMSELPLIQDGPEPDFNATVSPSRICFYDKATGKATKQFAYLLDSIAAFTTGFHVNGAVEILAFNKSAFLVMERSFSVGKGTTVKIYKINTEHATDISNIDALANAKYKAVVKTLLIDFSTLPLKNRVDNLEGISWGPKLANGNYTLIAIADNNFNTTGAQVNQIIAFEVILSD